MNPDCEIVRDLLPLYVEHMASAGSAAMVERHVAACAACRGQLQDMQAPPAAETSEAGGVPLRHLRRLLRRRRFVAMALTAVLVAVSVVIVFVNLTAPRYLPDPVGTVTKEADGSVLLSLAADATGYDCHRAFSDSGSTVYVVSAWDTLWDRLFTPRGAQHVRLAPDKGTALAVYASPNDGGEARLVAGTPAQAGLSALPRVVLAYYLLIAFLTAAILLVLALLLRQKPATRRLIGYALPLPLAYILGHLCVKGFTVKTYASVRDFAAILLVALALYLVYLLVRCLCRAKAADSRS